MKTKKDFLDNYASCPELARKALNAGGVAWSDILAGRWDYYDAGSGSVPGMVYYEDTVKFARKNHLLILEALDRFEDECGRLSSRPSTTDKTQYFNWLAWFAWENTMSEVLSYLESD